MNQVPSQKNAAQQTRINPEDMQPQFWLDLWHRGHIGFHQANASRYLLRHWQSLAIEPGRQVFVPLCGKSLDLLWLRDQDHPVMGVELSDMAIQSFCIENGVPARRRIAELFDIYEAPRLDLFCGDFFTLIPDWLKTVSAVYDRAALVSWDAEMRECYVDKMTDLTPHGTKTLLITLEYPQEQKAGPPFSVPIVEIERLYAPHHSIQELSREDILSDEPRMRARGVTQLHEVCYKLKRL